MEELQIIKAVGLGASSFVLFGFFYYLGGLRLRRKHEQREANARVADRLNRLRQS